MCVGLCDGVVVIVGVGRSVGHRLGLRGGRGVGVGGVNVDAGAWGPNARDAHRGGGEQREQEPVRNYLAHNTSET